MGTRTNTAIGGITGKYYFDDKLTVTGAVEKIGVNSKTSVGLEKALDNNWTLVAGVINTQSPGQPRNVGVSAGIKYEFG